MNTQIELDSGFIYRSWWGGGLRSLTPEQLDKYPMYGGDFCDIRTYHSLTKHTINGVDWIQVYHLEQGQSAEDAYITYYSTCGNYHIVRYRGGYRIPYFLVYEAVTPRKNMQSTFGEYVQGIGKKEFKSFEECAEAVANHIRSNHA